MRPREKKSREISSSKSNNKTLAHLNALKRNKQQQQQQQIQSRQFEGKKRREEKRRRSLVDASGGANDDDDDAIAAVFIQVTQVHASSREQKTQTNSKLKEANAAAKERSWKK